MTFSSTFKTSDGERLPFEKSGDGPTLVLIHGFGTSSRVFHRQVKALKSHFTIYTFDLRGHGQAHAINHGARVPRLAADLNDLIRHENIGNAGLLGWSMGCSVIWAYLDVFGDEKIGSYAFLDQIPYVLEDRNSLGCEISQLDPAPLIGLTTRFADPKTRSKEVTGFLTGMLTNQSLPEMDILMDDAGKTSNGLATGLLLDAISTDYRDVIARLRRPALIVNGECSFFHPDFFRWMHRTAPSSTHIAYPEAGHFLLLEQADQLNADLLHFFRRTQV